jgi:hypothetical protein
MQQSTQKLNTISQNSLMTTWQDDFTLQPTLQITLSNNTINTLLHILNHCMWSEQSWNCGFNSAENHFRTSSWKPTHWLILMIFALMQSDQHFLHSQTPLRVEQQHQLTDTFLMSRFSNNSWIWSSPDLLTTNQLTLNRENNHQNQSKSIRMKILHVLYVFKNISSTYYYQLVI